MGGFLLLIGIVAVGLDFQRFISVPTISVIMKNMVGTFWVWKKVSSAEKREFMK